MKNNPHITAKRATEFYEASIDKNLAELIIYSATMDSNAYHEAGLLSLDCKKATIYDGTFSSAHSVVLQVCSRSGCTSTHEVTVLGGTFTSTAADNSVMRVGASQGGTSVNNSIPTLTIGATGTDGPSLTNYAGGAVIETDKLYGGGTFKIFSGSFVQNANDNVIKFRAQVACSVDIAGGTFSCGAGVTAGLVYMNHEMIYNIKISGGTLTATGTQNIVEKNSGVLKITGGNFHHSGSGAIVACGAGGYNNQEDPLTVTGGHFNHTGTGAVFSASSKIAFDINLTGLTISAAGNIVCAEKGNFNITDCDFTSTASDAVLFKSSTDVTATFTDTNVQATASGKAGVVTNGAAVAYVGGSITDGEGASSNVVIIISKFAVGDVTYDSLADALAAADKGGTLKLMAGGALVLDQNDTYVIDMNGQSVVSIELSKGTVGFKDPLDLPVTLKGNVYFADTLVNAPIYVAGGYPTIRNVTCRVAGGTVITVTDGYCYVRNSTLIGDRILDHADGLRECSLYNCTVIDTSETADGCLIGNVTVDPDIILLAKSEEDAVAGTAARVLYGGAPYYLWMKREGVVSTNDAATAKNPTMEAGASVRIDAAMTNGGIRFTSQVSADVISQLTAEGVTLAYGTLIAPADYVAVAGGFTHAKLDAFAAGKNFSVYADVVADKSLVVDETTGNVSFNAALVDIQAANYSRAFAAVSYVMVTDDATGKVTYYYSRYDSAANARSIEQIVTAAIDSDVSDVKPESELVYSATVEGTVYYSTRYNEAQIVALFAMKETIAA